MLNHERMIIINYVQITFNGTINQSNFLKKYYQYKKAYESIYNNSIWELTQYGAIESRYRYPKIMKVIYNKPYNTIVEWEDGTKTKVKCCTNDFFSEEAGIALECVLKPQTCSKVAQ
jgi:hypothetical protein